MRRVVLMIGVLLVLVMVVCAAPWAKTYSLAGSTVAVTNSQANSVWMPAAVVWNFAGTASGTVSVSRISQGNTYLLSRYEVPTNSPTVVWIAECAYPFAVGDVLVLTSSETNGVLQLILKEP